MRYLLLTLLCFSGAACAAERDPAATYSVAYSARFPDTPGPVDVAITVTQPSHRLRVLRLNAPPGRFSDFAGDGGIERKTESDPLRWEVPETGGTLRYRVSVDQPRGSAWDARLTPDWAILRLGDLFPPASARTLKGTESRATLSLEGPPGWAFETPYGPIEGAAEISRADRRFDRPVGWMIAGKLGIRRDVIEGRRVAVAAPVGSNFRRQDTLAFLRWTLPELVTVFPSFPGRLLVVGAPAAMWRGGLSGPASIYLHEARPLISENATSTMLHEMIHVATSDAVTDADDWLVEGLAEYYTLELLRRSGTISERRFARALGDLAEWAETDSGALRDPSTGADTAFAVGVVHGIAEELRSTQTSMDDVTGKLLASGTLSGDRLRQLLEAALGRPSAALSTASQQASGRPTE